jgi:DNA-binding MltR family transcriptional regulator
MSKEPTFRDPKEWSHFYDELKTESDRGCAVIGGAMIDQSLSQLIASFLVDDPPAVNYLLDPSGPLVSQPTRARLAYCLGILSTKQRDDIIAIGKIRNKFAHNLNGATFEQDEIKNECNKLRSYYDTYIPALPSDNSQATPRKFFQVAIAVLVQGLVVESTRLSLAKRTLEIPRDTFLDPS